MNSTTLNNSSKNTKSIVFMNSIGTHIWRGGEKWMVNAAAGLAGRGHDILCIGKKKAVWLQKAKQRDVAIKELPISGDFDPIIIVRLFFLFKHKRIDVLCCNFEKDVRLGGIAARIAGVPLIYVRKGLCLMYHKWRYEMAYRFIVHKIISPAYYIKDQFKEFTWLNQSRIDVVHNGVEIPNTLTFDPLALRKLIPNSNGPLILAAGSLFSQKGFEYLIDALKILHSQSIFAHVVIAGAGDKTPYQNQAETLGISSFVHFPGEQKNLSELMFGANCFVLSSIDEGLPNVVLEAMAVGTPVVAADAGGTNEIITNGENGFIVPIKNSNLLAEKIVLVLTNKVLNEEIGRKGKETVIKSFSINAMVDSVERLFLA